MVQTWQKRASLREPGIVLGMGIGGFVDGIVLHQILQWHHMLSATAEYPPTELDGLQVNVMADGLFHAATWAFVVVGVAWLWRRVRFGGWVWSGKHLLGWLAVGWGLFNLVEGLVNHHLLAIHRVRPDAAEPLLWDIGFLAAGVILIAGGLALQGTGSDSDD